MPSPILSVDQMRAWERATWATGIREQTVMRRAGQAVARVAEFLTEPEDRILFLAGKGHNGDDAAFAHEYLADRAKDLLRITDPATVSSQLTPLLARRPALIVDGLFGIGLNRPLSADWIRLIEEINAAGPVLAVDTPSGLDADTGLPLGAAIRATHTLTFGAIKRGMFASTAVEFVGRLEVEREIGLVPCPFREIDTAICPEDFLNYPPPRLTTAHKGSFGHLAILAGSLGFHGAAVLAARAAQRAQPGLITLCVPEAIYSPVASQLQAVMVHSYSEGPRFPENITAILLGPGLADPDLPGGLRAFTRELWERSPLPVIADASALDWLPAGAESRALRVITPHPGEAARLLGVSVAAVQADRPGALRALSSQFPNCWVVLKGHQTVIGRADGELAVNLSGNPHLAQGGSGDVLAGYLAALLAQPQLNRDPSMALRFAVWQHGAVADQLHRSNPNFTIEDLADALGSLKPKECFHES